MCSLNRSTPASSRHTAQKPQRRRTRRQEGKGSVNKDNRGSSFSGSDIATESFAFWRRPCQLGHQQDSDWTRFGLSTGGRLPQVGVLACKMRSSSSFDGVRWVQRPLIRLPRYIYRITVFQSVFSNYWIETFEILELCPFNSLNPLCTNTLGLRWYHPCAHETAKAPNLVVYK